MGFGEQSLRCVVDLVVVLGGGAGVRGGHASVDGRGAAAAVAVVVGQRAGAGGQVDVLHVLHLGPTHRTCLEGENNMERILQ